MENEKLISDKEGSETSLTNKSKEAGEKLVFRMPDVRALRIPFIVPRPNTPFSSTLLLIYGFAALIILGTILLILPVSSTSGRFTSPIDALFTATSAVCVTGLVVVDTGTYWSTFGQGVLFALFQIGGIGFITGATTILLAIGGRLGLRERLFLTESMGLDQLGGILTVVFRVTIFAVAVEGIGAALFYLRMSAVSDTAPSLWTAVFHAASAFNNCGMDIFGNFQSLTGFQQDAGILLITALLIIFGSTGYVVIADLIRHRNFRKLSLDSKIVLTTTSSLLILGTLFYFIAEFSSPATLGPIPFPQKLVVAFFQSVTPRTAGFTAVDIGSLKQITLFFTIFLMCIGGATGSAAGGMKVNTFGVLALSFICIVRGNENIGAFRRQLNHQTLFRAMALFFFYLGIASLTTIALSIAEVFPIDKILFETFSALGTVGLSTGITPDLSTLGRLILIAAMFTGRLGPLTFMAYLIRRRHRVELEYPHENIRLG
ncbi:MAG: potassium transporter TrkG [Dehalococcoidales bacterium]|nr:potassium transporter TrkG [Dehalococcoidales bacterium]